MCDKICLRNQLIAIIFDCASKCQVIRRTFVENRFTELDRAAWGGFLETYAHMNRLVEEDLQEHAQITHAEFEVLLRLFFEEPQRLRIQELAAHSILTLSGVSRLVERLEKAGLVTRETASEDRRGAYAVLTSAGAERFQAAAEAHMTFVKKHFLSRFSPQELEQMAGFWKRIKESE